MNRESLLPLSISALLALCLHASIILWYGLLPAQEAKAAVTSQPAPKPILPDPIPMPKPPEPVKPPQPPVPEKPKPPEPKHEPKPEPKAEPAPEPKPEPAAAKAPTPKPLEIGRDGEPVRSTIAWIPYDDFKKLMAPESLTIQPALQTQADPVAGAPIEINPSTAKPTPATILTHSRNQQDEQTEQANQPEQPDQQPIDEPAPTAVATAGTPPVQQAKSTETSPAVLTDTPPDTTSNTLAEKSPAVVATAKQSDDDAAPSEPVAKPPAGMKIADGRDLPDVKPLPDTSSATPALPQDTADQDSADAANVEQANADQTTKPVEKPAEPDNNNLTPTETAANGNQSNESKQPDNRLALAPLKNVNPIKSPADEPQAKPPATPTKPSKPSKPAAVASESNENRPTSVPRSDRESIATQNTPMPDQIVLGRVLVSDGIEIKTVRPRFNISTLFTASPRNPIATIVFDKTGQVVRAELVVSSGFADIDSPILNSLYQWRASGKKLENHQSDTFTIRHMKLLLVDDRKANDSKEDSAAQGTHKDAPKPGASPDTSPSE